MLIIEIDGGYHSERKQKEDDELRTERLNELGFRVIRFSNEEVQFNIEEVLKKIQNTLRE